MTVPQGNDGKSTHFFPTFQTHAILPVLPLPDGSPTCRTRREEGLRGLAVTCGGPMEEAVHRRVPLAASTPGSGEGPSQPPEKSLPLVPGPRRPAVRARVETGRWRAALRMRGGCGDQTPLPWRPRIANARPGACRTMPPVLCAAHVRAEWRRTRNCLSDADTIRR